MPELHEVLKTEFSNAPSLPSLKRWAAAGRLKAAEIHRKLARPSRSKAATAPDGVDQEEGGQARVRYDRHKAIKVIQQFWEIKPADQVGPFTAPAASSQMPGADEVLIMMENLSQQIAAQSKIIEAATAAVAQLNGLRAVLMTKYDSVTTNQAHVIDGLRQRIADSEKTSSMERDIQRLNISVSRLHEKVDQLRGRPCWHHSR